MGLREIGGITAILTRSALLSILLAAAIAFVGWSTYVSWKSAPWDLPVPNKLESSARVTEKQSLALPKAPLNTDAIVAKNLFDPERGAGATREAEESSRASQRIRNMILVGTVIIGNNRTAVLQEGGNPTPGQATPAQPAGTLRLRLGDNVEGYRLSEIADKRVVFTKDAARVELVLDYFRKVEVAPPRAGLPRPANPPAVIAPGPGPRVIPNLPRRGRIPLPGNPAPNS